MTRDPEYSEWPPEAGDPNALPSEMQPPAELEEHVVSELRRRGLIRIGRRSGWSTSRLWRAAAAAAVLTIGILIGRATATRGPAPETALTGAETDLYALLLYETKGYRSPTAQEAATRYGEYSAWVAEARRRGQFVTGEDLEVDRGWLLTPSADGTAVQPATTVSGVAPLSGIFFIRARDADHALVLAQELPHVKHGGRVLVQKTIPTDVPPPSPR